MGNFASFSARENINEDVLYNPIFKSETFTLKQEVIADMSLINWKTSVEDAQSA